ncbi:tRNA adenosine(34) deaminase TadA [Phytoactinopolyspora mesophila]|nr:tRNA adenosine(34) deaminase TadA [Phytoactinopolyspora mesophila]
MSPTPRPSAALVQLYAPAMRSALSEGRQALSTADVPVGALVVDTRGNIIASNHNRREADRDPTAHAEILAIRAAAAAVGSWRLDGLTVVVTLEPCTMCAGALVLARVSTVVYGAADPKAGAAGSLYDVLRDRRLNHQPEVIGGVLADRCSDLLQEFFAAQRAE